MRLLMLSGDEFIARKKHNIFYNVLAEYSKYWDSIDVITPGGFSRETFSIHGNVSIHPSLRRGLRHVRYIYQKGLEVCRNTPIDLMTTHDYPPFTMGFGGWWLHKKTGIPYVSELLHIVGHPKAPNLKEHLGREMSKLYFKYMWKSTSAIRVVNRIEVPELLRQLGVPDSHILVTTCFHLNFDVFKPMDVQKTGRKVIFTGRLVPNKGVIELLRAFRLVREAVPDAELIIVGDGTLKTKLVRLAQKLEIADRVEFKGMVPHNDVAVLNNQCDLFVFPSYNEGAPRSVGEAMACELPVITTNIGIMKELIRDGENGMFITWDPNDIAEKIILLLRNEELRKKIAVNGRESVQPYTYTTTIREVAVRYHELIRRLRTS